MNKLIKFAIPFHISNYFELKNTNFEELTTKGWEKKHVISGEHDLFDYITGLTNGKEHSCIASSWMLKKQPHLKDKYETEFADKCVKWSFSNMGLILFNTEIGIIWYEIETNNIMDINDLYNFIYALKELSYSNKIATNRFISFRVEGENCEIANQIKNKPEIKSVNFVETKEGVILKAKETINLYGNVLLNFLKPLKIDSFFSNRGKNDQLQPDKAMAFVWCNEANSQYDEMKSKDIAFHLGRNYKANYEMSSKINEEDFYMPFNDSIWYGGLEGCANYTYPATEKSFYLEGYNSRLNSYYYLYLLCLGQYYSLLELAHEVTELPTDEQMYSSKNNYLEKMLDKIHIFNLKNIYSQVGFMTHYNEYYEYLQKRFNINKMQQELEVEVQSLYEMIDRKHTIRSANRFKILSIISGVFVIIQTFANLIPMYDSFANFDWIRLGFGLLGLIVAVLVGVIILLLGKLNDKVVSSKEKKQHKI